MKKGFTLIEMLSVVMVVAILAAVAVPQYRRSVERARLSEAIQMLPAIYDAVDRYYVAKPATMESVKLNNTGTGKVIGGFDSYKDQVAAERTSADKKYELVVESMKDKATVKPSVVGETAKMPISEVADEKVTTFPLFGKEEAEMITFSQLDLNLKGKIGAEDNIWRTPNFTYEILMLPDEFARPYFVAATVEKGKYKETIFGYTGSQVLCVEPEKGPHGACALMNLKTPQEMKPASETVKPEEEVSAGNENVKPFIPAEEAAAAVDEDLKAEEAEIGEPIETSYMDFIRNERAISGERAKAIP